ncbi:hypothetical protein B0H13DRAFT_1909635 [Mycena leptocephala]|nr:hypothetical protein B0H13DRAFT_1909635 [Mycena leptocephala]
MAREFPYLVHVTRAQSGHLSPARKSHIAKAFTAAFITFKPHKAYDGGKKLPFWGGGALHRHALTGGGQQRAGTCTEYLKSNVVGKDKIFFGSSTTAGTSTIPAATRSAWASFIATATASQSSLSSKTNSASQKGVGLAVGVTLSMLVHGGGPFTICEVRVILRATGPRKCFKKPSSCTERYSMYCGYYSRNVTYLTATSLTPSHLVDA